jgi:hypothetical protein
MEEKAPTTVVPEKAPQGKRPDGLQQLVGEEEERQQRRRRRPTKVPSC